MHLKLPQQFKKTAEPTGDLINNKVAVAVARSCGDGDKITITAL